MTADETRDSSRDSSRGKRHAPQLRYSKHGGILRSGSLHRIPGTYEVNRTAVRDARFARLWRQRDLAEHYGCTPSYVASWESLSLFADQTFARQLASVLFDDARRWRELVIGADDALDMSDANSDAISDQADGGAA